MLLPLGYCCNPGNPEIAYFIKGGLKLAERLLLF